MGFNTKRKCDARSGCVGLFYLIRINPTVLLCVNF